MYEWTGFGIRTFAASGTGVTSVWEKIAAHVKVLDVFHMETIINYRCYSVKFTTQNDLYR